MNKRIFFLSLLVAFSPLAVFAAQSYDLKELTPEVKTALDSRRERFDELKALKAKGVIGENNKGYVEAINGDAESLELLNAENKDRKFIYQTIAEQNNLPAGAISTIEIVFAGVQRDKAAAGDKIQDADGNWISKE